MEMVVTFRYYSKKYNALLNWNVSGNREVDTYSSLVSHFYKHLPEKYEK